MSTYYFVIKTKYGQKEVSVESDQGIFAKELASRLYNVNERDLFLQRVEHAGSNREARSHNRTRQTEAYSSEGGDGTLLPILTFLPLSVCALFVGSLAYAYMEPFSLHDGVRLIIAAVAG